MGQASLYCSIPAIIHFFATEGTEGTEGTEPDSTAEDAEDAENFG